MAEPRPIYIGSEQTQYPTTRLSKEEIAWLGPQIRDFKKDVNFPQDFTNVASVIRRNSHRLGSRILTIDILYNPSEDPKSLILQAAKRFSSEMGIYHDVEEEGGVEKLDFGVVHPMMEISAEEFARYVNTMGGISKKPRSIGYFAATDTGWELGVFNTGTQSITDLRYPEDF